MCKLLERGQKVGQIEVIPWRRRDVREGETEEEKVGGGGRGGVGGHSPESVKLETSDARLGVRAGGWEPSCGAAVWGRQQDAGEEGGRQLPIHRGSRRVLRVTFGAGESHGGHWRIRKWTWSLTGGEIHPSGGKIPSKHFFFLLSILFSVTFVFTRRAGR